MIYVAYFILLFAIIRLFVALVNFVFYQKLTSDKSNDQRNLVSVLIPARNEESNIANLLSDLSNQNYQNLEIIVFNDQSDDNTASVVTIFSKKDNRIRLINSDGLPNGWLGKNYACHSLSKQATGDFLLFLDADVRIKTDLITKTLLFAKKHNLGLLSIFPKQKMRNLGEQFTVPVMNYILLSLLPLILVRSSSFASLSAANGQFMLFNAIIYKKFWPHELMKSERVEDIKISRYFKKKKIHIACIASTDSISCRMYQNYGEAVNGFSKNFIMFFGNSYIFATLFWLITTFGFIFILTFLTQKLIILYLSIVILVRILISAVSNQSIAFNLLYIIPQHISMGVILYRSIMNSLKKEHKWKGRSV